MQFTLPLPPTLNQSYKINKHTGTLYKTPEAKAWQEQAEWIMKTKKLPSEPLQGKVAVKITLFFKFDRDWDGSNKLICDSMQNIGIYKNDKQIYDGHVKKEKDPANPRLEVSVYAIE